MRSKMKFAPAALAALALACASPTLAQDAAPVLGTSGYIEYVPGNAPVIITAPHGGRMKPDSIADRVAQNCGGRAVTALDINTQELARAMRESFFARYGTYPHLVINRLSRRKLDPNRAIEEAACGSAEAESAYKEWQGFIDQARAAVVRDFGKGWYMDIHGHGHLNQRVEIGYLLTAQNLGMRDAAMNADAWMRERSSIRMLGKGVPFAELLRGPDALGSLLAREGFPAVPSDKDPDPGEEKYFSAGYNTLRHTCSARAESVDGDPRGLVCGVQFETNYRGIRDTPGNRRKFGDAVARVTGEYLKRYFGLDLAER